MTARIAFDIGSTSLNRIRNSPAPSILAASMSSVGTLFMKNDRSTMRLKALSAIGRISDQ